MSVSLLSSDHLSSSSRSTSNPPSPSSESSFQSQTLRVVTLTAPESGNHSPGFPSPSSSFLPPPTASPHEFAAVPKKKQSISSQLRSSTGSQPQSPMQAMSSSSTGTGSSKDTRTDHGNVLEQQTTIHLPSDLLTPSTPTPSTPTPKPSLISISATSSPSATLGSPITPTSSRPAPPSPAPSRRASRAISTTSSTGSLSRTNSSSTKPKRASKLSMTYSPRDELPKNPLRASTSSTPTTTTGQKKNTDLIHIIDFGFPVDDVRRAGQGGDIPKPNRIERLNRKLRARTHSLSSTASAPSDDDDEEEEDDDDHSGFAGLDARMLESQIGGGFKWGVARMSWGPGGQNGGVGVPEASENDFARNFEDEEDEEDDEGTFRSLLSLSILARRRLLSFCVSRSSLAFFFSRIAAPLCICHSFLSIPCVFFTFLAFFSRLCRACCAFPCFVRLPPFLLCGSSPFSLYGVSSPFLTYCHALRYPVAVHRPLFAVSLRL
ncbi:hypothetical protein BDV98DRAFT_110467 [Pterulicium gracile]|uniref:Uncharacterized protein n=1 Tax=Pterulicium gracile TaxID=1884261 RepID=A0A5C3QDX8_9AGAR|nr:hypothetical protein BDV98DRAFT_110467 [Pterula gracilis]